MSPPARRERVVARSSGLSHKDIYPNGSECARILGFERSAPSRWGRGDSANPLNKFSQYLLHAVRPWELVAHASTMAKWRTIVERDLSHQGLIEHYWQLLEMQARIKAADHLIDLQPNHSWDDRYQAKKKVVACASELAAVMHEFDTLEITWEQVREGAP